MKRIDYYNQMATPEKLAQLHHIETAAELQEYIGKPLLFGYNVKKDNTQSRLSIIESIATPTDNLYCVWYGILKDTNIEDYVKRHNSIFRTDLYIDNFVYLYRKHNFLNISKNRDYVSMKQTVNVNRNYSCNAQRFILVPSPQLLCYYHLCCMRINAQK